MAGMYQENEEVEVKQLLSNLENGRPFCDLDFTASSKNLYLDPESEEPIIVWKRPHELCAEPCMFVDGASRSDVSQGGLGDCWFLSACSAVAMRKELIEHVIPPGQVLFGEGYNGMITVRFWTMGKWVSVHIDDRLPTDEDGALAYASCKDPNEFWLPLLEKAFAKFHGNYHLLDGGSLVEGFVNLTGFIVECFITADLEKKDVFRLIRQELLRDSLITCSRNEVEKQGLVANHAYTITGAKRLQLDSGLVRLVRVRNPWGKQEWTGAWSDKDSRWNELEDSIKNDLEYNADDDGEFWIKTAHFVTQFEDVTIAMNVADFGEYNGDSAKQLFLMHNEWTQDINAGGCQNNIEKYATNPQYQLIVEETDDMVITTTKGICEEVSDDDEEVSTCNVMVELVQEHNRKKFPEMNALGIHLYKSLKPDQRLCGEDITNLDEVEGSKDHIYASSVVSRLALEPGRYVIIPSTFEPDQNRRFLLRVYSRKPIQVQPL